MWNIVKHRTEEIKDNGCSHDVTHPAQDGFHKTHLFGNPVRDNPHDEESQENKNYVRSHRYRFSIHFCAFTNASIHGVISSFLRFAG